ncbi:hypothetical protein ACN9ML_21390 [Dyadobacter endophyticus]|uniref:hypothetical protein n=1 Tax=Dyadobacter endophyticus TaxID=1749036 RepID=UPI003CED5B94
MNSGLRSKSRCLLIGGLVAIAALSRGFGQGKMLDSYIVSAKGDTVRGFIRYDGWGTSPMTVDFAREKDGGVEKLGPSAAAQFYISSLNERYISKRIGILNIDLSKTYELAPSFEATDSVTVYLRQVTSGPKAALLEYLDLTEQSHFFLEKDGKLTELFNYPFYRVTGGKKYLIQYDEYVRQLPVLLSDGADNGPVRSYSAKDLGRYVDRYNGVSASEKQRKGAAAESEMEVDAYVMGGIEAWEETDVNLGATPTFGAGLRINLPRRFHNRYFKILFATMPGVSVSKVYNYIPDEKISLNTLDVGAGTYIGSGDFRPNIGFEYSFPMDSWRTSILGPHVGISYRRRFSLEVTHFGNFSSLFSDDVTFFNRPRISLNYYMNLNKLFKSGR